MFFEGFPGFLGNAGNGLESGYKIQVGLKILNPARRSVSRVAQDVRIVENPRLLEFWMEQTWQAKDPVIAENFGKENEIFMLWFFSQAYEFP